MADLRIKAEIIGLNEEVEKNVGLIRKQVPKALQFVGSELKSDLQATLHREWYEKYKPTDYPRRTDEPSLGTPIGDDSNFDYSANGTMLDFAFNPTWQHARRTPWSNSPDKGIEWIQSSHKYEKTGVEIPARPFWNIFLNDQAHGGLIDKFIRGMSPFEVFAESQDSNINLTEFELPAD